MAVERELIIIKPDGVRRGLIGEIISRFERKGFKIIALKMLKLSKQQAERLYKIHSNKPFFKNLVEFMTSGPIVAFIIEGDAAISVARKMVGETDGRKASPGTIRGDYALSIQENLVHASDSPESFTYEAGVIFGEETEYLY